MTMKFLECMLIFVLSWERDLTKRDHKLKLHKIYVIPLSTSFLEKVWTLSQNFIRKIIVHELFKYIHIWKYRAVAASQVGQVST